jgi:Arc/MetJ-type ribon-helix-helix transcriptional regulator
MTRIGIDMPNEMEARLREEAARRRMSVSALTREAIQRLLDERRRRIAGGKFWHSGNPNVSEQIEEILSRK